MGILYLDPSKASETSEMAAPVGSASGGVRNILVWDLKVQLNSAFKDYGFPADPRGKLQLVATEAQNDPEMILQYLYIHIYVYMGPRFSVTW